MLGLLLLSILFVTTVRCEQNNAVNYDILQLSDREIIRQLVSEIQQLKQDRDHDRQEMNYLKEDNTINKERISELERTAKTQNEEMAALRQSIEAAINEKTQMKQNRSVYNAPNRNVMKGYIHESTEQKVQKSRRLISEQPVAFSSYVQPNADLDHLGAHQNIVFDQIFINLSNVYNVHQGVFTVPVSGIYVITANILSGHNREVHAEISVNGNGKAHIHLAKVLIDIKKIVSDRLEVLLGVYVRGTDGRHDQGSQTILLQLKHGDDVSVRNVAADDSVYGAAYTTFSGFLLYEDENNQIIG